MQSSSAADNAAAEIKAQNQATLANLAQDQQYADQANKVFQGTLKTFQPAQQTAKLGTSQQNDTQVLQNNAPTAQQLGTVTTQFAPKVVQTDAANKTAARVATGTARNAAAGNLAGYDSTMLDNGLYMKNIADRLGTISDFAQRNAALAPLEREAAMNNAYQPVSPIAGMLTALGGIGTSLVGQGAFTPNPYQGGLYNGGLYGM